MSESNEEKSIALPSHPVVTSATDVDRLFAFLETAASVVTHQLDVQEKSIVISEKQMELEKMRVENSYDLNSKTIELRREQFNAQLAFEKEQFSFKSKVLVGVIGFFMLLTSLLLFLAPDASQRLTILTSAAGIALALIGGKGIASLFDKPKVTPQFPTPPYPPQA